MADTEIDTGDHVHHGPTGEEWLVAYVRGGMLAPCGWPEGLAKLSDCTLVRKATPSERRALLERLAKIRDHDSRAVHARAVLAAEDASAAIPKASADDQARNLMRYDPADGLPPQHVAPTFRCPEPGCEITSAHVHGTAPGPTINRIRHAPTLDSFYVAAQAQAAQDAATIQRQAEEIARLRAAASQAEPLARFCPGCGSVGFVPSDGFTCCPDHGDARMIPERLARQCRNLWHAAVDGVIAAEQREVPHG